MVKGIGRVVSIAVVGVLLWARWSHSQGTAAPAAAPAAVEPVQMDMTPSKPEEAPRSAAPKAAGMSALVQSLSTDKIDFNFKDADILGILRSFAIKFNKNIIAGPGVSGKVTLQLRNVPFDEAFGILLSQMDLVAVQKSANVISIIRTKDMPVLAQVFNLKYRFARELAETVASMLNKKEQESTIISVDLASNALIVTSTSDILQKIKLMIDETDIEAPQVKIKARLIEVTAGDALNTGVAWAAGSKFNRNGQSGQERAVMNMNNFTQSVLDGSIETNQALTKFPQGGLFDFAAVMDRHTLYGVINALQTDTRTKTISEPTILTGNNKSSKIHVGQNLPVRTSLVSQTSTVQSVTYIQEGVDLDVTPIVSPGSTIISFKVKVSVSELVGFQDNNPITTERAASTEVSVESGKTVVIGGLIKNKMIDTDSGVPFLKDIPILGYLFKTKKKSNEKTELLIFITPELLATSTTAR